jgi:hypothetical protein
MQARRWSTLGVCLLFTACSSDNRGNAMAPSADEIKLRPIEQLPGAPVRAARLVNNGPDVTLLMSSTRPATATERAETTLFSMELGGKTRGPSQLLSIPQFLPPPPDWDAAWRPSEGLTVAYQKAGGALNAVLLQNIGAEPPASLTARHPFESFSRPRFVRGPTGAPRLVSMIADNQTAVLFEVPIGNKPSSYKKLGHCEDAFVVTRQKGLGLLCKVTVPGPSLQNILPGTLSYISLGEDLQPLEVPVVLLGGQPVFGFDADLLGEKLVILAVTAAGPRLETLGQSSGQAIRLALPTDSKGNLSSPSLRIMSSQVYISLVDDEGSAAGRVVVGQAPQTALR